MVGIVREHGERFAFGAELGTQFRALFRVCYLAVLALVIRKFKSIVASFFPPNKCMFSFTVLEMLFC